MIHITKEVDLLLIRKWFTDRSTIGEFYLIDKLTQQQAKECFILEDVSRATGVKIAHITSIPADDYLIKITHSERFNRLLPLIYNQADFSIKHGSAIFTGVRMHAGNEDKDTDACQLTGQTKSKDFVGSSVNAFDALFKKLFDKVGTTGVLKYRIVNEQQQ